MILTTWHLFRKDVQRQKRGIALLWCAVLIWAISSAQIPSKKPFEIDFPLSVMGPLSRLGMDLAAIVLFVRCLSMDPSGSNPGFLSTRPVPWHAILASKFLFGALFLVLPIVLGTELAIYSIGIPLTGFHLLLYLTELILYIWAMLALAAIPAFFWNDSGMLCFGILASYGIVAFNFAGLDDLSFKNCLIITGMGAIVAIMRYRFKWGFAVVSLAWGLAFTVLGFLLVPEAGTNYGNRLIGDGSRCTMGEVKRESDSLNVYFEINRIQMLGEPKSSGGVNVYLLQEGRAVKEASICYSTDFWKPFTVEDKVQATFYLDPHETLQNARLIVVPNGQSGALVSYEFKDVRLTQTPLSEHK